MPLIPLVLIVLAGLAGVVWASRHYLISRQRASDEVLTPESPSPTGECPAISVIVSAKDEEGNISACVESMLAQDYPNFEMIVCSDRSRDRTAAIVRNLAAGDARLRLIELDHKPDGWTGKCHGMWTAASAARGEYLCMIDADCRQVSARTLSAAMREAQDSLADMLSVLPVLEMRGFWENVVQPVCGGVMMIWYRPDKVNDPARSDAYANGAFILMRRSAYDAVGAHQAVRDKLMEDMHLAARVKRAGMPLRVVQSRGLYVVRMYTSLSAILRGWGRIFFGTFGTLGRLAISLAVMVLMGLLPYVAAIAGLAMAGSPGQAQGWWLACGIVGLAATALQLSAVWRFYKLIGARKELAWTYAVGCIITLIALVIAATKHRRGAKVVWRDTAYSKTGSR
jgi:hypothetical protein